MDKRAKLQERLKAPEMLIVPGAYDCVSARLIERAHFEAVYMTGYGACGSLLGKPDVGLLTMTEMVAHARNINQAVGVPLIADADTGYGGTANVVRTVQEYEQAGVAAIHLEDQTFPKRCGGMKGKDLIPMEEYLKKLEAALKARRDPNFLIIARTDAAGVLGIEEAIRRSQAYETAGADAIFINSPRSLDDLKRISGALKKPILHSNYVEKLQTPFLTVKDFAALNCKILILPLTLLFLATKAMQDFLKGYQASGTTEGYASAMLSHAQFEELVGIREFLSLG